MVRVDPQRQAEYREAYDAWQKQLTRMHDVFLEGDPLPPPKLKGLLNREARAKHRYDAARDALLGIGALPNHMLNPTPTTPSGPAALDAMRERP